MALLLALLCNGCENGNCISWKYAEHGSKTPEGAIDWLIDAGENKGQLPENSASNLSIGVLNAADPNPDDEVSYF